MASGRADGDVLVPLGDAADWCGVWVVWSATPIVLAGWGFVVVGRGVCSGTVERGAGCGCLAVVWLLGCLVGRWVVGAWALGLVGGLW